MPMSPSNRKIVVISPASEKNALSKAQRLFNSLIKKIDAEKKLLREWQEFSPEFQRIFVQ